MTSITMPKSPPPQAPAKGLIDALRLELIEEAVDLAIPFLIGVHEAARAGEVARVGEVLRALRLAAQLMRRAHREIAQSGDDPGRGA